MFFLLILGICGSAYIDVLNPKLKKKGEVYVQIIHVTIYLNTVEMRGKILKGCSTPYVLENIF